MPCTKEKTALRKASSKQKSDCTPKKSPQTEKCKSAKKNFRKKKKALEGCLDSESKKKFQKFLKQTVSN
jgi:hypothetical protein